MQTAAAVVLGGHTRAFLEDFGEVGRGAKAGAKGDVGDAVTGGQQKILGGAETAIDHVATQGHSRFLLYKAAHVVGVIVKCGGDLLVGERGALAVFMHVFQDLPAQLAMLTGVPVRNFQEAKLQHSGGALSVQRDPIDKAFGAFGEQGAKLGQVLDDGGGEGGRQIVGKHARRVEVVSICGAQRGFDMGIIQAQIEVQHGDAGLLFKGNVEMIAAGRGEIDGGTADDGMFFAVDHDVSRYVFEKEHAAVIANAGALGGVKGLLVQSGIADVGV